MFIYDCHNIAYYDEGLSIHSSATTFADQVYQAIDYYSFGATLFHLITGQIHNRLLGVQKTLDVTLPRASVVSRPQLIS
jgi:hypothetical protein